MGSGRDGEAGGAGLTRLTRIAGNISAAGSHLVPSTKSRKQVEREAASISERERSAQKMLYWPNA